MHEEITQTLRWTLFRDADNAGALVYRLGQKDLETHDHLFHEVVVVEQGSGIHRTASGAAPLRPGDIVVLRPRVWHGYEKTKNLQIINCLVDSRLMVRLGSFLSQVPGSFDLYRRRTSRSKQEQHAHLHARPAQAKMLIDRLNQMIVEQQHRLPGWQTTMAVGALDVLIHCARLASQEGQLRAGDTPIERATISRTQQAVLDATAIIEAKFHQEMSLNELAEAVHLSPGHLSRSFSRLMGMSIVSYIHRLRSEEACRLLLATNQPVSEIGPLVGYHEIAYFSRCFRQQIGVSPKQYRLKKMPQASSDR